MVTKRVLIVEDDISIREMTRTVLEAADFRVIEAGDADDAYCRICEQDPDLILLDWMLPGASGLDLIARLRSEIPSLRTPIMLVTAKAAENDMIKGLNAGADDYITKPFSPRELIARMSALFRRVEPLTRIGRLVEQDLELDSDSHRVFIKGQAIKMGPTEFKLLRFFMSHADRAFSRDQILDLVWRTNVFVSERTVDVHVRRLRSALRRVDSNIDYGGFIQTVRGKGYRFSSM